MEKNHIKGLIQKFKEFRLERNLTLQQTALLLNMSHSAIAEILNGSTSKPHETTIYKIRKLLGE